MSCSWFPGACLVVAMLAGPASLMADEQIVDEIETLFLEAEESKRIADGWVEDVVVTGDRSIRLTGERDQVQQAIGAVMLADQRFADNDVELARSIARVYSVKHADPQALASLINRTGPDVQADPTLQVVVLSGRVEQVESAMAVLAELDVAREVSAQSEEDPVQRDVVFDVYLVGAYSGPHEFPALPAVPQSAVEGFRETFPFASYSLLEAFTIRASPGGSDASVRGYLDSDQLTEYRFQAEVESSHEESGSISLSDVWLVLRTYSKETGTQESEIRTNLTIQESKTVVVGKAGIRGVADGVFLVLRARFD